jgi:hypothetical protein
MSDLQLERIEARLRTLTILQQRTRLQIERIGAELADLVAVLRSARHGVSPTRDDGTV